MKILLALLALIAFSSLDALVSSGNFHLLPMAENEERQLRVSLANPFDHELVVTLAQNDFQCHANGENDFLPPNSLSRSNADWIKLPFRQLILKPNEERHIHLSIKTPTQVPLNGDYWSLLMVEPQTVTQQQTVHEGFQLQVKLRYAVLIITRVRDGTANLKVIGSETDDEHYTVDIENDGELYLAPKVSLKVFDANGTLITDQESPRQRLVPSSSARYSLPLPDRSDRDLQGILILDGGHGHVYGEKIKLRQ